MTTHFPSGGGFEGIAAIDAAGADVEGFSIGQHFFAQNYEGGNWAQYAVAPADRAYPVLTTSTTSRSRRS